MNKDKQLVNHRSREILIDQLDYDPQIVVAKKASDQMLNIQDIESNMSEARRRESDMPNISPGLVSVKVTSKLSESVLTKISSENAKSRLSRQSRRSSNQSEYRLSNF